MELALIRSLMTKDFYDNHRGAKCPDRLFSKDVRKIKSTLDKAMRTYERDVTPDEIEALFISGNPTLTTAQKQAYGSLFVQIKKEQPLGSDIAQEVLPVLGLAPISIRCPEFTPSIFLHKLGILNVQRASKSLRDSSVSISISSHCIFRLGVKSSAYCSSILRSGSRFDFSPLT